MKKRLASNYLKINQPGQNNKEEDIDDSGSTTQDKMSIGKTEEMEINENKLLEDIDPVG